MAISVLCSGSLVAQSLADVARAEEARRRALKAPVKVYTNEDLGKGQEAAAPSTAPADTSNVKPGGSGAASAAKTSPAGTPAAQSETARGKDEKYWRSRITDARSALQRSQAFLDALQSQINGLYHSSST